VSNIIGDIEGVVNVADSVIAELGKLFASINTSDLDSFFQIVNNGANKDSSYGVHLLSQGVSAFDRELGRLIVQPLIEGTMGVNYATLIEDSSGAINTLESAVGFSLVLDGVTSGLDAVLKTILGDRAPEYILETIRKIPQAVGMEYFLGITLASTFEKAVGTPLEEAINIQVLPSRLDINTIRQLLRQHRISEAEADAYRKKLGYPESDWASFLLMESNLMPIADLQSAYEYGLLSEDQINTYLQQQGYADADIAIMLELYLHNSETSGGQVYRSVARTAYLENAISSDMFKSILKTAGVPDNSITMELQALDLQKSIGLKQLSAADIKWSYENNDLTAAEVETRLKDAGYSADDIALIMKEWDIGTVLSGPKVTAKTIIRYYRSKIITMSQAESFLVKLGMRDTDITQILASPTQLGSGYVHEINPTTIIAAYKDGLLTQDEATAKLEEIGVTPDYATELIQIAVYAGIHKKQPKQSGKTLSVADIKDGLKYGTASEAWALRELVAYGYSTDDAGYIIATYMTELTGNVPAGWIILS